MYGDGIIYEEKSRNKWIYQYYDNHGKRHKKRFNTEQEARRFKHESLVAKDAGLLIKTTETVMSWVIDWLVTYKKPKLRPSSLERMMQAAAYLEPIADVPLDELRPFEVQRLYNSLRDRLSSSSIAKTHRVLFGAYKKAMMLQMIPSNPMEAVEPPIVKTAEKQIFTFLDLVRIFRAIRTIKNDPENKSGVHDYHLIFMLLLTSGMRVSEMLALHWGDIDFDNRAIHISKSKSKTSKINKPKTAAGVRSIPIIHTPTLAALKAARPENTEQAAHAFVFATRTGNPLDYQRIYQTWLRIQKLSGVKKTIHTFRHTFATVGLAKGIPITEMSRILGHADVATTLNMYSHAIPDYNQKIIEMFNKK